MKMYQFNRLNLLTVVVHMCHTVSPPVAKIFTDGEYNKFLADLLTLATLSTVETHTFQECGFFVGG